MTIISILLALTVVIAITAPTMLKGRAGMTDGKMPYKAKCVLTNAEQILFFRLTEALPNKIILAQTQMSSFLLVTESGKERQTALNKILQKSTDFLVCNKDFSVFAAIELQDKTHLRPDRIKSDNFKRISLAMAGVKLIEFHTKSMPTLEEITEAVNMPITITFPAQ
ncbi:MAG: DUF2726 domain-containing protein [Azoarcus sp.]|jgi:hypothetical protein|nr:DUF2726 domain-containing protein [Azoarcus sp.]